VKELGRGGMGVVYKARHTTLNRDVALKVMLSDFAPNEQDVRRFLREAEACAQLKHPNIVPVFDINDFEGKYYFAMEFVEGTTLLDWSKKEPRSLETIVAIMQKVCDALAYAHQRGIIHRDLKPHNVMVDPQGEPKVMDFGLAKQVDKKVQGAEKTMVGTIMGTPQYMPPEQATGRIDDVDTRSDVYALGVILYELVTGELPINAGSLQELLHKIEHEEPPPLRAKRPDAPWEIEVIVAKAMAKEKAQRFQSAQELADDLGRYLRKEPIRARKASLAYRAKKFVQRNRTGSAIAATVVVMLGIGGWAAYRESRRELEKAVADAEGRIADLGARIAAEKKEGATRSPAEELERLKRIEADLDGLKKAVATAERYGKGDERVLAARDGVRNLSTDYDGLNRETAARLEHDRDIADRRAKATEKVASAKKSREGVKLDLLMPVPEIDKLSGSLDAARGLLMEAVGLDDTDAAGARVELGKNMSAANQLAAKRIVAQRRHDFEDSLQAGKDKLDAARALTLEDDEQAAERGERDAAGLKFQDAAADFQRAYGIEPTEDAKKGIVDATLEDATVLVEDQHEFAMARRAIARVEKLAPLERVDRMRRLIRREEAKAKNFTDLVEKARGSRAGGHFGPAAELFKQALEIDPERRDLQVGYALSKARALCEEKRHLEELPLVMQAVNVAESPSDQADAEGERARVLAEFADRATEAGRIGDAVRIVDQALKSRDDPDVRRIKVELTGRQKVARGMVFVSEGPFRFSLRTEEDTAVAAFLIGETEVTNAEFKAFVEAGGYTMPELRRLWPKGAEEHLAKGDFHSRDKLTPGPAGWVGGKPIPGTEDLPVVGVSWYEAWAYAAFRGMRLPTEVEWEKAAVYDRASRRSLPPPWERAAAEWGTWDEVWAAYFGFFDERRPGSTVEGPKPVKVEVGKRRDGKPVFDQSPCGAYDMYGNVHEWVAERMPDGRVIARGGSFLSRLPDRSAPTRRYQARPEFREEHVGFRLATEAPD
jgi:formylglycine-generating enzyme required for sulfatase activity/tRNA A-37 threonylcarbamoyl transferase component Bud32